MRVEQAVRIARKEFKCYISVEKDITIYDSGDREESWRVYVNNSKRSASAYGKKSFEEAFKCVKKEMKEKEEVKTNGE